MRQRERTQIASQGRYLSPGQGGQPGQGGEADLEGSKVGRSAGGMVTQRMPKRKELGRPPFSSLHFTSGPVKVSGFFCPRSPSRLGGGGRGAHIPPGQEGPTSLHRLHESREYQGNRLGADSGSTVALRQRPTGPSPQTASPWPLPT